MGNKKLVITLIIIVAILIVALTGAIIYIVIDKDNITNNNTVVNTSRNNYNSDKEEDDDNETENSLEQQAMEMFNEKFEKYVGNNVSASNINSLLKEIETSNSMFEDYVSINPTGITDSSNLSSSKKYSVELSYGDNGYVEEVTILESNPLEDGDNEASGSGDMAKAVFNAQFTSYLGKITGTQLNSLLGTIQSSNSANPEHQISLTSNNLQDLNGIVATDEYVITLTYDDNNYVKNINIDKNEI